MADEAELKVEEGSGGKKKLFIIIGAVVVLLIVGGVAAFMFMGGEEEAPPAAAAAEAQPAPVNSTALYVGMPRPFVFNVTGDVRDRLVQIKVQLLVRGSDNEAAAKLHIPTIEGALLKTFSAATVDELSTQEGKEKLRETSLAETQKALQELTGGVVVEKVLFTGFVMQ